MGSNPVLTTKNLPTLPKESPELDDSIIARPLMMPEFLDLRPKNPAHTLRGVNLNHDKGSHYFKMKTAGFVDATPEDVLMRDGSPIQGNYVKDNRVIYGDLIVMKIDRLKYLGALKYNALTARQRVSRNAIAQQGGKMLREELSGTSAPPELKAKIQTFVPSDAEVAGMVGKDRSTVR